MLEKGRDGWSNLLPLQRRDALTVKWRLVRPRIWIKNESDIGGFV